MSELQLEIALETMANPLKKALAEGRFVFLTECSAPENEQDLNRAAEKIMPLAEKMWSLEDMHGGVAVLDNAGNGFSPAELASVFPESRRNNNIFYLSGRSRSEADIQRELKIAAGAAICNLAAVSGNADGMNLKICRNTAFCGSGHTLRLLREAGCFHPGAVINPFHHHAPTMLATLGSLKNKLNNGAEYIVVQSGWDMLQIQTLSWYMLRNRFYTPFLVRLTLLTPEKVEKIQAGAIPGLRFSREFSKMLEQELCGSNAQFEAAQYRRLELQAAGARFMGASGVQISGINYPGKAEIIANRLRSALDEFQSFEHWLDEYNRHQASAEMLLSRYRFRLFDRILRRPYPFDDPPQCNDPGTFPMSRKERFVLRLRRWLFARADRRNSNHKLLLKKLLANCRSCGNCRLPQHEFVCVENCPKGIEHGPCGGVREDGKCEIGGFECIHVKIMRFSSNGKRSVYLES